MKVTRTVHVSDPETGRTVILHRGDTVPDWAESLVTNPSVIAEDKNLEDLTRDELDALAVDVGLDPTEHRTKADLITALQNVE